MRATALVAALVALTLPVWVAAPPTWAAKVDEEQVREIGSQLRCVVCQSMSVADSPSETAHQMREMIRERLAAGDTPEQVRAYFVDKYGLWILLSPPRQGFNLLVWIVPFIGLGLGLVLVFVLVRRWSRRTGSVEALATPVDPAMQERIRREMSERPR